MPKTTLDGTKKKKQKLGKKKLAPTNATTTVFKSKSIVLLEQDVFRSDKGPVTKRQLTFRELTTQLRHYIANVRADAVRVITEEIMGRASFKSAIQQQLAVQALGAGMEYRLHPVRPTRLWAPHPLPTPGLRAHACAGVDQDCKGAVARALRPRDIGAG